MKLYKDLAKTDEGFTCCLICHEEGFPEDYDDIYEELEQKLKHEPTDKEADDYYNQVRANWEMYANQDEWFKHLRTHKKEEIVYYFQEQVERGRIVIEED